MASRRIKVLINGQHKDAEEVHVESIHENVNTYALSDQTALSLRTVVVSVARVLGEWNEEGQPVYVVRHQTIVSVSAPEKLLKPL